MEPILRTWYADLDKVAVQETGLLVPKWDDRLGSSPDGLVGDKGIVEFKAPRQLYEAYEQHMERLATGWRPEPLYHDHIQPRHYAQMQGTLTISRREWCDYVIYDSRTGMIYCERIPLNQPYWRDDLYPGIESFFTTALPLAQINPPSKWATR